MVDPENVLILGGYGNTGRLMARLFLEHSPVRLVIAGRNTQSAVRFQHELNQTYPGQRVSAVTVDAADEQGLVTALRGVDLLVVASSTTDFAPAIARAALQAGCDYLDINLGGEKLKRLQSLTREIADAGRCFVTEGGFHPGLPAVLIRAAAEQVDALQQAIVASYMGIDWAKLTFSQATLTEFVLELAAYRSLELVDGHWQKMRWNKPVRKVDFGGDTGIRGVFPMYLEELGELPDELESLRDAGFYVAGFNPVVDYLILPVGWLLLKIAPRRMSSVVGRLMLWGLQTFSKPPFGTVLLLQADGEKAGESVHIELRLEHKDGYFLTAAAAVAGALQVLDTSHRKPGLWLQGNFAAPQKMLADLESMGVLVTSRTGPGQN